ncbi:MAG: endonuclease III domain-containing protein [Anaerolineae bacterium]
MNSNDFDLRAKALEIHERLVNIYGEPRRRHPDPVTALVSTIISQNTNDRLRDRAFQRLHERFPTWEQVRDAPVEELTEAIRPAGLAQQKAPRIKEALQRITYERGELSLDFLRDMDVEEGKAWLTSINGVGPKTAAIVLLFSLGKPAFPVDTHVHRVSRRLGLIGPKTTREQAHLLLEELLPIEIYYTFHLNMVAHGRQVCKASQPRCGICGLHSMCEYL